jgi:hypothetical protein
MKYSRLPELEGLACCLCHLLKISWFPGEILNSLCHGLEWAFHRCLLGMSASQTRSIHLIWKELKHRDLLDRENH